MLATQKLIYIEDFYLANVKIANLIAINSLVWAVSLVVSLFKLPENIALFFLWK